MFQQEQKTNKKKTPGNGNDHSLLQPAGSTDNSASLCPLPSQKSHIFNFFFGCLKRFLLSGDRRKRSHSSQGRTHLPDGPIANPNDVEESGHDLRQELHALEAKGFENKGDGLDHHGVVMGQGLIPEDPHERHHGDGRIELVQREVSHVNQHLTGAVVSWKGEGLSIQCLQSATGDQHPKQAETGLGVMTFMDLRCKNLKEDGASHQIHWMP